MKYFGKQSELIVNKSKKKEKKNIFDYEFSIISVQQIIFSRKKKEWINWNYLNYFSSKDILLLDEYVINIGKAALFSSTKALATSTYKNWDLIIDGDKIEFFKRLAISGTSAAATTVGHEITGNIIGESSNHALKINEALLLLKITHSFLSGYQENGLEGGLKDAKKKLISGTGFILGSKAGAIAGSFGGPAGVIIGSIIGGTAGSVAANYADEFSGEFLQNLDYSIFINTSKNILARLPTLSFQLKLPKIDPIFNYSNYLPKINFKAYLSRSNAKSN